MRDLRMAIPSAKAIFAAWPALSLSTCPTEHTSARPGPALARALARELGNRALPICHDPLNGSGAPRAVGTPQPGQRRRPAPAGKRAGPSRATAGPRAPPAPPAGSARRRDDRRRTSGSHARDFSPEVAAALEAGAPRVPVRGPPFLRRGRAPASGIVPARNRCRFPGYLRELAAFDGSPPFPRIAGGARRILALAWRAPPSSVSSSARSRPAGSLRAASACADAPRRFSASERSKGAKITSLLNASNAFGRRRPFQAQADWRSHAQTGRAALALLRSFSHPDAPSLRRGRRRKIRSTRPTPMRFFRLSSLSEARLRSSKA